MCRIAIRDGLSSTVRHIEFHSKGNIMATAKSASTTKKAATATKKTTAAAKPAAKKPAAAKPVAKKVAAPKAAAKKPAAATKTAAAKPAAVKAAAPKKPAARKSADKYVPSPEQRYRMVQDAAYFLAEKNSFAGGAMDYWIAAEIQIETLLSGK